MRWTLEADHFGDDNATIWAQTSNRSAPFEWDRIAPGKVRVSIGGLPLPITNQAYPPAFADDFSGAEWTLAAEVTEGAVVLVLTARDQRRPSDRVGSITLTAGGSGYTSRPTISFTGGDGSGASAVAVAADKVASVAMTNGGRGYTVNTQYALTFTGGGAATDATATAGTISSPVGVVRVDNMGSGYTSVPSVSFSGGGGGGSGAAAVAVGPTGIRSVTLSQMGRGYDGITPTVSFPARPGGVRATGVVVKDSSGDRIASVTITNPGLGYTSTTLRDPDFSNPPSGPGHHEAVGVSVLEDRVTSVRVTNPGSGYTSSPTCSITGSATCTTLAAVAIDPGTIAVTSTGSGYTSTPTVTFPAPTGANPITATGTAVMTDTVVSVRLTNRGSGYTSAPTVVFSGGGPGTGAAAVAELALTGNDEAGNLYFARQALYGKELVIELTEEATGS